MVHLDLARRASTTTRQEARRHQSVLPTPQLPRRHGCQACCFQTQKCGRRWYFTWSYKEGRLAQERGRPKPYKSKSRRHAARCGTHKLLPVRLPRGNGRTTDDSANRSTSTRHHEFGNNMKAGHTGDRNLSQTRILPPSRPHRRAAPHQRPKRRSAVRRFRDSRRPTNLKEFISESCSPSRTRPIPSYRRCQE